MNSWQLSKIYLLVTLMSFLMKEVIVVAKIKEDPNFFLDMQRGSLLPNRKLGHFILIMVV